ncbi:hypothetical protein XH96_09545 [Bradyrhizobium sp. CCBAU 51765]|nr:hypothetical protein XH96_09545 [Bradyrhizobium sp. CCBAU 51765]
MIPRLSPHRHCEEPLRRSNPDCLRGKTLDCFAALAMTECMAALRAIQHCLVSRTKVPEDDTAPSTVIARSLCDEAIQTVSAERFWIASLCSQ